MNESSRNDEISLRELYLILKRGLPLVIVLAAVAGLLAFAVMSFRPNLYEAESTVLITPSPVQPQRPGSLTLSLPDISSFEVYQALANSRSVLDAAVSRVSQAGISADELRRQGRLVRLLGPQRPDQVAPLSVTHVVQHSDPELAVVLADAWAESALEAVRNVLLAGLSPVAVATSTELTRAAAALEAIEVRWRTFQGQDDGEQLTSLLSGTTLQLAEGEARLAELERQIAATEAKQALLRDRLSDLGPVTFDLLPQLAIAEAEQAGLSLLRAQLEALPEAPDAQLYHQTIAILDLTEYQRTGLTLAASLAERDALLSQQQRLQAHAIELRQEMAALNEQRSRLERELSTARGAYSDAVAIQPIISYVTELAPTNARLLSQASLPSEPVGPRRLLTTVLAVVIAGMLAVVFVFLRQAVSPPSVAAKGEVAAEAAPLGAQSR